MINLLISMIIAIVLFLCFLLAYREGLRLGLNASKGIEPKPIKNPVKAFADLKNNIKADKEAKEEQQEIEMLFAYNGDIPKKGR